MLWSKFIYFDEGIVLNDVNADRDNIYDKIFLTFFLQIYPVFFLFHEDEWKQQIFQCHWHAIQFSLTSALGSWPTLLCFSFMVSESFQNTGPIHWSDHWSVSLYPHSNALSMNFMAINTFRYQDLGNNITCTSVIYLNNLRCDFSICTTCLLSILQTIALSPRHTCVAKFKQKSLHLNLSAFCFCGSSIYSFVVIS